VSKSKIPLRDIYKVQWNSVTSVAHLMTYNPHVLLCTEDGVGSVLEVFVKILYETTHAKVKTIAAKASAKVVLTGCYHEVGKKIAAR